MPRRLRVVTALERRYAAFDGLNLTWETLEGLVKHNGPLTDRDGRPVGRYRERGVPQAILDYMRQQDLELWSFASAEAQVAAIADDIAYDAHDIDDGLRAGLFGLDDLAACRSCAISYPTSAASRPTKAAPCTSSCAALITRMIEDVIAETGARLTALAPARPAMCAAPAPRSEPSRRRWRTPTAPSRAFCIRACTGTSG